MPLHSLSSSSRSFGLMTPFTPILDFFGAAALTVLTTVHIVFLFETISIDFLTTSLVIISAALNVIGLVVAIAYQRAVFSITFFFTWIFFSLAPMQQLMTHFDPVMEDPSILMRAFTFSLMFSAMCLTTLIMMGPTKISRLVSPHPDRPALSPGALAATFGVLCIAIGIGLIGFGQGLFTDRTTYSDILSSDNSQPIYLLYTGGLRPFTIYGSVVGLWIALSHRQIGWCAAFGATLMGGLLLSNPLITPRFEVATLIYTIAFYFGGRRHNRLLVIGLLAGVALAPFFNLFRLGDARIEQHDFGSFLASADFDAFSLLCHTIWHVDYYGLDYGNNIVSAILFFVPRAIWPSKSEVTPFYLMDSLHTYRGLWNTNLSEPLIAEGYFAFGIIGIVAITLIYACFAWFLELKAGENRLNTIYLFCCASPPLLFILLRGSLIVAVAVVTGHLLAINLSIKLATFRFQIASAKHGFRLSRSSPPPLRVSPPR